MKIIACDGKTLEVRDCGPVLVRLTARRGGPPIPEHGTRVVEDAEARAVLRRLIDSELYERSENP